LLKVIFREGIMSGGKKIVEGLEQALAFARGDDPMAFIATLTRYKRQPAGVISIVTDASNVVRVRFIRLKCR
jgi:hypothetical protein